VLTALDENAAREPKKAFRHFDDSKIASTVKRILGLFGRTTSVKLIAENLLEIFSKRTQKSNDVPSRDVATTCRRKEALLALTFLLSGMCVVYFPFFSLSIS
jgi:hypothetical protein